MGPALFCLPSVRISQRQVFSLGRCHIALLCLFLIRTAPSAWAELEVRGTPQTVFGGGKRTVTVQLCNRTTGSTEATLRTRLYQASAATLAPLGPATPWKSLSLGAGQTALETFDAEIPPVRGQTVFHIAFFEGEKKLGSIELHAFPGDLLKSLSTIAGEEPLALLDPEHKLDSALHGIPFKELNDAADIASS